MGEIQGLVFHSRLDYISEHIDYFTIKKIGDLLSPQVSQIVLDQVFSVNEYPFKFLKELDSLLPKFVPISSQLLFHEIGSCFVDTILNRCFFNSIELQKPHRYLIQFQRLYPRLWNWGQCQLKAKTNQKVNMVFLYEEDIHQEYHWFTESFLKKSVEISGGKNVLIKSIPCNKQDEDTRVYSIK